MTFLHSLRVKFIVYSMKKESTENLSTINNRKMPQSVQNYVKKWMFGDYTKKHWE